MNLFEQATRIKLRFETTRGLLAAEDLWDLPLTHATKTNLDEIARSLFLAIKENTDISFVKPAQAASTELQLAFGIVKHVIDVRLAEKTEAEAAAAKKAKREQLLGLIEQKQNEHLSQKSIDELRKELETL